MNFQENGLTESHADGPLVADPSDYLKLHDSAGRCPPTTGKVLHTYAVDLSGSTADVARSLDRLAGWIERRAAAASPNHASAYG